MNPESCVVVQFYGLWFGPHIFGGIVENSIVSVGCALSNRTNAINEAEKIADWLHDPHPYIACNMIFWRRANMFVFSLNSWASYQIRKIAGCACAGNAGNVFPRRRFQRKPLVSDPGMHNGTCVTHVPWCMSGSLTCGDGKYVPGIPGACAPAILRIW